MANNTAKDFSVGKMSRNILSQSVPLIVANLVHLLYNVVDRIYIGHLPGIGSLALTGIGLAFPLTTLIAAFTNLFATGGTPLFSIARGQRNEERAEKIIGQVFFWLILLSVILFTLCYTFKKPILYAFGASDESFSFANDYLKIYLCGTLFAMISTGMNGFINASGFPKVGMATVTIGALLNIALDPLFIFVFRWGVSGAALATVLSQAASFLWVILFFKGKKTAYRIRLVHMKPDRQLTGRICSLGLSGFIMQGTNFAVQIVCNMTLRTFGGDLYVGIMTILNSVREIAALPVQSLTAGSQPVLGYNYGARKYARVREGIRFSSITGAVYMVAAWIAVISIPHLLISIFTSDAAMIEAGTRVLRIYFFGFLFMGLQFSAQSSFTALGCAKRAVFFSIFRKVILVVPLTLLLPVHGFGVNGVFMAEPISNVIGGLASFTVMILTLYRTLPKKDEV